MPALMARPRLRLFVGPEHNPPREQPLDHSREQAADDDTVTLPLDELLPLLADAYNSRRTWLADFGDDAVTIPADLYEVLAAYQHHRPPAA
jgi:hypothetical protein